MLHASKVLLALIAAVPLFAQFHGGIQGTVSDPSGAVVPSVAITLKNLETNRVLHANSDSAGAYRFLELTPGSYLLQAERKGFKTLSETVTVDAESVQTSNLVLQPGEVTATVTVVGDTSPAVETTNGDVSRAITSQEVTALPQVGRNPYELLRLTPGIFGAT